MPPSVRSTPRVERIDTLLTACTDPRPGSTVLHVNDTHVVLRPHDDGRTLVMQAHICRLPRHSGPRAALCEALLLANAQLSHSDRLGIALAEQVALYQRVVDIDLDAEALGQELWDLIEAAEQLRLGLTGD